MIVIDGSQGEGGGQILRTSLSLSLVTGQPFRIEKIRANRRKPGLRAQHLTAVRAAAELSGAEAEGAELSSTSVTFGPGEVRAGTYRFDVGTAGSCTLVLQTVLPALIQGDPGGRTELTLEGGTHNPWAPPYDFLSRSFLPLLGRMGARVQTRLDRPGFYPAGGGRIRVSIDPVARLGELRLTERGEVLERAAVARVARLPRHIAERELKQVKKSLGWPGETLQVEEISQSAGPGNVVVLVVASEQVTCVKTGFGEKGVRAERVAAGAAQEMKRYLDAGVPVDEWLADQLLLPLALAGGGEFRTLAPSLHLRTNAEVIQTFLDREVRLERRDPDDWLVSLPP